MYSFLSLQFKYLLVFYQTSSSKERTYPVYDLSKANINCSVDQNKWKLQCNVFLFLIILYFIYFTTQYKNSNQSLEYNNDYILGRTLAQKKKVFALQVCCRFMRFFRIFKTKTLMFDFFNLYAHVLVFKKMFLKYDLHFKFIIHYFLLSNHSVNVFFSNDKYTSFFVILCCCVKSSTYGNIKHIFLLRLFQCLSDPVVFLTAC